MIWFHIDMDAFFASVEQLDHPEYRNKPVIVGAAPGKRGVVCAASYEARKFGVRSAMPISTASKLCPLGIFVRPRMNRYQELSAQIMQIFNEFTPELIQISIDEAFLNMSGTERLLGKPEIIVQSIKSLVRSKIGLAFSVGIATNKLVAKMASSYQKPDGCTIIAPGAESEFVAQLAFDKIWGLGEKTRERLEQRGIRSTAELLKLSQADLCRTLGNNGGTWVWNIVRGIDPGIYEGEVESHSISREITFEDDLADSEYFSEILYQLACDIQFRLHAEKTVSHTLCIKYRNSFFETFSVQKTFERPLDNIEDTWALAKSLFFNRWQSGMTLRLIGLGFHNVSLDSLMQGELFAENSQKRRQVEQTVLGLNSKFAKGSISKARLLQGQDNHNQ